MEPSASARAPDTVELGADDRRALLALADAAIRRGLDGLAPPQIDPASAPAALRQRAGAFVTVTVDRRLNGCIGAVWPTEELWAAVPRAAWEAAFDDPRLPALRRSDLDATAIMISVLSDPMPMEVRSRAELIAVLRPGVDGLVITDGVRRATFLPVVWEKVGDPADFLAHLEAKAGMAERSWGAGVRAWRYTAIELGGEQADAADLAMGAG